MAKFTERDPSQLYLSCTPHGSGNPYECRAEQTHQQMSLSDCCKRYGNLLQRRHARSTLGEGSFEN